MATISPCRVGLAAPLFTPVAHDPHDPLPARSLRRRKRRDWRAPPRSPDASLVHGQDSGIADSSSDCAATERAAKPGPQATAPIDKPNALLDHMTTSPNRLTTGDPPVAIARCRLREPHRHPFDSGASSTLGTRTLFPSCPRKRAPQSLPPVRARAGSGLNRGGRSVPAALGPRFRGGDEMGKREPSV